MREGERQISYQQLLNSALRVAQHLPALQGQRYVVAMERGVDAAICIYGILLAGGCYVPLDINNPAQRIAYIIEDTDPAMIIGKGAEPEWLNPKYRWCDFNTVFSTPQDLATSTEPGFDTKPSELAAILYTSGSTGQPKGVALSHQAMKTFSDWALNTFNLNPKHRIASLAPFHFDLSVFDLFSGLSSGASIHFIPSKLTLSPSRLTQWLRENQISTWYTVPSILTFLALKGGLQQTGLPNMQQILFAGEVFSSEYLIKLCNVLPEVRFYNLYGPTETNVCCYWPVERSRLDPKQAIPIGMPACGSELKIDMNSGELWVNSVTNFSGYWQNKQLQQVTLLNGYYPTGDQVSINEFDEYCYHGRIDRMLKCSGFRVEPAEIEAVIKTIPGVINCAIIGLNDPFSGQRPAAVLQLQDTSNSAEIMTQVKSSLPVYMQPVKVRLVNQLPLLSNGKIDYQQIADFLEN